MLVFALLTFCAVQVAHAQVSGKTVAKAEPSTNTSRVGETFTVSITIADVENLYGLDVSLRWNASVIEALGTDARLGVESHPGGVLHEISPNADIYLAQDNLTQAEYNLVATSVNPAPPFSGNGTIVNITFKAISLGQSSLDLETELADYPQPGEPSNLIQHTDIGGSIAVVASETPSETPDSGWLIPIAGGLIVLFLVLAAFALVYFKRRQKRKTVQ